jgi:hypothetical protein
MLNYQTRVLSFMLQNSLLVHKSVALSELKENPSWSQLSIQ